MIRRNVVLGAAATALLCAGCGPSGTTSEPQQSLTPPTSAPSALESTPSVTSTPDPTFPAGATSYAPVVLNACGLAGTEQQAVPLGCAEDTSVITYGSTRSLKIEPGSGIPATSAAHFVDDKALVAIRTGERPNVKGAVTVIDGATGSATSVDLGDRLPYSAGAAKNGIVIGTIDGRIAFVSVTGQVKDLGSVDSPVAAVASSGSRVWVLQESGSLGWIASSGGTVHRVADVKGFQREGFAATNGELWVLTRRQGIRRFSGDNELGALDVPSDSLSLTPCANGVWLRSRSAADEATDYTLLSEAGRSLKRWRPPAFIGYSACSGNAVWGLAVDGSLYRSPRGTQ